MKNKKEPYIIISVVFIGLLVRLFYASYFPITRDEGAYIYDGLLIKEGFIPFKDFFTRSPVLIYTLSAFVAVTGKTIFAGRILSILCSLVSVFLFYLVGKELFGKRVAKIALFLFALLPSAVLQTIYAHTQPFLIFLLLLATYLFVVGFKNKKAAFFILSGLFLGLAILVRHSAAAYLLWEIILLLVLFGENIQTKAKSSAFIILGSLLSALPISAYLISKAGWEKIWLTLGPGLLFRLGASSESSGGFIQILARQKIPALFLISEESLLIIFLTIFFLMPFCLCFLKISRKKSKIITLLVSLVYFALLFIGARKMGIRGEFYTPSVLIPFLAIIWIVIATKLLDFSKKIKLKVKQLSFLIPFSFIITPLLSYGLWTKFHPNYFSEFLIGFTLAAAIFLASLKVEKMTALLKFSFTILIVATMFSSVHFALTLPHTGAFQIKPLYEARDYLRKNADPEDEIFTSAAIIPFLSGHRLVLNITHPTIYKYSWISEDIVAKLGPTLDDVQNYLEENKTPWVIVESSTRSDYFVDRADFYNYIKENYRLKKTIYNQIRNTPMPIEIYKRK